MTNSELSELKAACERIVAAIDLAKLPTFAHDINTLGLWLDGLECEVNQDIREAKV